MVSFKLKKRLIIVVCIFLLSKRATNDQNNFLFFPCTSNVSIMWFSLLQKRHHTEIHNDEWWINKFEMYGFKYSQSLTTKARKITDEERSKKIPLPIQDEDGQTKVYQADHLIFTLLVFINPLVASKPEHQHLLAEPGCYKARNENVQCGEEKYKVRCYSHYSISFHSPHCT